MAIMPKTTNLNLELTVDTATTLVADFQKSINGQGDGITQDKSNMQLIDEWAGTVNGLLTGLEALLAAI